MERNIVSSIKDFIIKRILNGNKSEFSKKVGYMSDSNAYEMVKNVLSDMQLSDDEDIITIANNISNLENFIGNISFKDDKYDIGNSVCKYEEDGLIELTLKNGASKTIVSHEFGHLIQDLVDDTFPDDYEETINITLENLTKNNLIYKQFLDQFIMYSNNISKSIDKTCKTFRAQKPDLVKKMVDDIYNDSEKRAEFIVRHTFYMSDTVRNSIFSSEDDMYNFINNNILMDYYNFEYIKKRENDKNLLRYSLVVDIINDINDGKNSNF